MEDVRPIRTEDDYDAALLEIERLWGAKLGTPEGDRLDVLATRSIPMNRHITRWTPPDPIEAIKFRMSQKKLTRKQLEPMIGTRTRVAEVLKLRRGLSIGMIRRPHATLGISAEVLISTISHCDGWETQDSRLEAPKGITWRQRALQKRGPAKRFVSDRRQRELTLNP